MSAARVAVVQFPGVNCETESVRALARVGLEAEVFRWTRPASAWDGPMPCLQRGASHRPAL